jgi:hypothetical protein
MLRHAAKKQRAEAEAGEQLGMSQGAPPEPEARTDLSAHPSARAASPSSFVAEAVAWHAEVRPGDLLYTPPYWWHHVVTGAEPALSVLVPWDPTAKEPAPACMLGIVKPA